MGFAVHTVANTEWLNVNQNLAADREIPAAMNGFVKGVYATSGSDTPELKLLDQVAIMRSSHWTI
jgi:purine-binding chemotaxis protein CheW